MKKFILSFCLLCALSAVAQTKIDLSGEWRFQLDSLNQGIEGAWHSAALNDCVTLPGTTDSNAKGIPNELKPALQKPQLLHLTRKHSYVGPAWYQRTFDVPREMAGKPLRIKLERVMWLSSLWVDGKQVGEPQESLVAPHVYVLPEGLNAGKHTIALRIDNSKQHDISVDNLAHAYTNDTQVMWNGVLGEMTMEALPSVYISNLRIYPDANARKVMVVADVMNLTKKTMKGDLSLSIKPLAAHASLSPYKQSCTFAPGDNAISVELPLPSDIKLWDMQSPNLFSVLASVDTKAGASSFESYSGLRSFVADGKQLKLNGEPIFLRGTLECCIFPLTGTPPTDEDGWLKVFSTAKEWGLNHLRFHSWCPPDAAFRVADRLGFCVQVELPQWSLKVGSNASDSAFIYDEFARISAAYGNHPSLCMMTCGNELQPDFDFLNRLTAHMKATDPRQLYACSTFTFENGHGKHPEPQDQFFITQYTDDGWVRGQGIFDAQPPRFDVDYSDAMGCVGVPLVSHEIGQYAVYPRLSEIDKYTGTLLPLNFMAVRDDMARKGLLPQAEAWTQASGKLAEILYKEEIERALKTPGFSGFQLLDLHDFPGQGTALVGLLDAFWDSKGITRASDFRRYCDDVVVLSRHPKAVYTEGDEFVSRLEVANYSGSALKGVPVRWELLANGKSVASGVLPACDIPNGGNASVGEVRVSLPDVGDACRYDFKAHVGDYENSWPLWTYPKDIEDAIAKYSHGIVVTDDFDAAMAALDNGAKVLLSMPIDSLNGLEGKFVQVFWSPVHFPAQAGTMGMFCDPSHEAFKHFPTESHTNWQWWHAMKNSKTLNISDIEGAMPIVGQVDNFANNRRLASVFEAKVGSGSLIFSGIDLLSPKAKESIAIRQFLSSLLQYMSSPAFAPAASVNPESLSSLCK